MIEQACEYQRPRRRDLRLARQRAEAQQTAVTQKISVAPARDAHMRGLHAKKTSRVRVSERKRAFVGAGLGLSCAVAAVGGLSLNHASQAQAAASRSVLSDSLLTKVQQDTPESLRNAPERQAIAQAGFQVKSAKAVATDTAALCAGFDKGADSLASAYVPDDVSLTYMPLHQGSYSVTSPFGMRTSPITGGSEMHRGVDMAGPAGTPIFSVANGKVLTVTQYGSNNGIVIEHHVNGKTFTTWYLHSYADDILVKPGDEVKAGQQISSVGSAGQSTGAHLHFEFHWGAGVDTSAVEPLGALKEIGAMWVGASCQL